MLQRYRIPTILGILILLVGVVVGVGIVGKDSLGLFPRAASEFTPRQVRLTNVSETGFSVSWVTDEATVGFVKLGKEANKLDQTLADDRDQKSGAVGNSLTHHVTVTSLKPGTDYWFKLGSGSGRAMYDSQGQPYKVTTATKLEGAPVAETAYGTVVTAGGDAAAGAVVYLQLSGATPLSTLVQENGNWVIPVAAARTSDLKGYVKYDPKETSIEILVQAGKDGTATAMTNASNAAPVPTMSLGQTYDFRQKGAEPETINQEPVRTATGAAQFSLLPLGEAGEASQGGSLVLLNPAREAAVVTSVQPEFLGKAPAGVTLTVTVESPQTYTDTVKVGSDGSWEWTPPEGLAPGEHTINVSYTDSQGKIQALRRSFIVAASAPVGGLPAFTASPSGQATSAATPAASVSAKKSLPSTVSGTPTAGNLTPTLILFMAGAVILAGGLGWRLRYE